MFLFDGEIYKWYIPSLRSKRFQSSYCANVRAEAKKRLKGEGEGRRGNACPQTPRFWKTPLDISRFLHSPPPPPPPSFIFFFCSCPSFLDEPPEETLATQASMFLSSKEGLFTHREKTATKLKLFR